MHKQFVKMVKESKSLVILAYLSRFYSFSEKGQLLEVKTGFKLYKQLIRTISKCEFLYILKN